MYNVKFAYILSESVTNNLYKNFYFVSLVLRHICNKLVAKLSVLIITLDVVIEV